MLLTGSIALEEPAARALADWLNTLISAKVTYLPAPEGLSVVN